ncbi:enoyl-CoA hydratase [Acrocarpospora pleiomorpha]|uniref:Enoyl-CoA hydratase n=1 Tax=Acrocarpospora pleiomorpha TaxID=90975 RepID=A0A5M3XJR4_9ACTN|nr:enoyl-CoA hydratase/isomerase family protein [Acrocarpospora pleiomorpha]GES19363.1 enoyl-CoA hydratase [Acrocarpospora pleiomorpha]
MSEPLVRTEQRGEVHIVWLNEPERKNPLSDPMIERLSAALRSPEARAAAAVVIRGAGRTFSAGGDLRQFHASLTTDASEQFEATTSFRRLFLDLDDLPGVTIAAVEGGAYGGGCGLAAACDIVIAAGTATFACPEIRLGAFPMVIAPALVRAIGARNTMALAVSGEKVGATRARELGLVAEVVDEPEFDSFLSAYVDRLAGVPAQVLHIGKMAVRAGGADDYRVGLESGSILRSLLFSSPAFHDGVNAFVQRARR